MRTFAMLALALMQYPKLPEGIALDANLPYAEHRQTVADVFYPKTRGGARRPGVLAIHGGGWRDGTKEGCYELLVLPYLRRGFVVASVEYRLSRVAPAPAAVEDVLRAAAWFRQNADRWNVDPARIVATGDSAGGHLALMTALAPASAGFGPTGNVAAVVNLYGIADVEDQIAGRGARDYAVAWIPPQPNRIDVARRLSPITYVRRGVPPVFSVHGDADDVVPFAHSARLSKGLAGAGSTGVLFPVRNGKHGFTGAELGQVYEQVFSFLREHGIMKGTAGSKS